MNFKKWLKETYMGSRPIAVRETPPELQGKRGTPDRPVRGGHLLDKIPDSSGDPAKRDWDSEEEPITDPNLATPKKSSYGIPSIPYDPDADNDEDYARELQHWRDLVNAGEKEDFRSWGREMYDLEKRDLDQIAADKELDQQYALQDKDLPVKKRDKENYRLLRPRTKKEKKAMVNKPVSGTKRSPYGSDHSVNAGPLSWKNYRDKQQKPVDIR